jgi:crotonobetainyl-CoA:carnitine CoA-transferase CaiB-like acyl-CoA transferase
VTVGAMLDGHRPKVAAPPPELGQDTQRLLLALGVTREEIETLTKDGVI